MTLHLERQRYNLFHPFWMQFNLPLVGEVHFLTKSYVCFDFTQE